MLLMLSMLRREGHGAKSNDDSDNFQALAESKDWYTIQSIVLLSIYNTVPRDEPRPIAARCMDDTNTSTANHNSPASQKVQDACTICLEPITERAVATPCNHLSFDFLCLVSWLQEQSSCPLCRAAVLEVQYDWRGPEDYKTYHVSLSKEDTTRPVASSTHSHQPYRRRAQPRRAIYPIRPPVDDILERRRRVYREGLPSLHIGANRISQYKDFTQQDFLASDELQTKAKQFLRRELKVFDFLDNNPRASSRDFLIVYIVFVLKSHELRGADGRAEDLVAEFLGKENASLLLHEMESWLRSPYLSLEDWDGEVQYPALRRELEERRIVKRRAG
ncbi:hypothetical protein CBER1_00178 [Cercospora berteroae]|uniref:RING-type E3 ubiquitin transferase n=1 Tax=Cercospora berteroae TaxID=357750 RepID=A0A2S6CDM0_9PEZI|nr:hypothetical protein CBER1_00178 [Cercospora berteroae]